MGIRFQVAPHQEARLTTENRQRMDIQRMLEGWAGGSRGPSVAARAALVGASTPGDRYGVLALEQMGVSLDDVEIHMFMSRDMARARAEKALTWNGEENQNDRFDLTANPVNLAREIGGWWGRSPGERIGGNTPAPVRTVSRWFMMFADAELDLVTDRVLRAFVQSAGENGTGDLGALFAGAYDEYIHGENIGNKPFWLALEKVFNGEELNIGTGFIAHSELAPDVEEQMAGYEKSLALRSNQVYNDFENDRSEYDQYASFATPYSQMSYESNRGRPIALNSAIATSSEQAALGEPITQISQAKQEAYGIPLGGQGPTVVERDAMGRPHWTQVSWGRIYADMVTEPGTTPYQWVSAGGDFSKQIFADPLNYGPLVVGKTRMLRNTVRLTEQGGQRAIEAIAIEKAAMGLREAPSVYNLDAISALKAAGVEPDINLLNAIYNAQTDASGILLAQRARKTVAEGAANRYLTGSQAQPMVTALTEASTMRAVDTILSNVKNHPGLSTMRGQLAKATTEGEVIDILLPRVSQMDLVGNMNATARLASYDNLARAFLARPVTSLFDMGFRVVDDITGTGLDAMYQIQQRGIRAINPFNEFMPRDAAGTSVRAQVRNIYGNTWGGRMVNNQSNAAIPTNDIDLGYLATVRLVRNMSLEADSKLARTSAGNVIESSTIDGLHAQLGVGENIVGQIMDVDQALYRFSQLSNGNGSGAFDQIRKIYDAFDMKMEMDGIPASYRHAVSAMVREQGEKALFFVNAIGKTGEYPGTGFMPMLNGEATVQPGAQLISEFFSGKINVPDPRLMRRTLAEKHTLTAAMNVLTTQKKVFPKISITGSDGVKFDFVPRGNLDDAVALRLGRVFLSNVWKPMKLLRFGYIPKVVLGDEQGRMTAAGLASIWAPGRVGKGDSPLAYLAFLFGRKGKNDVFGNRMSAAREFQDTVSLHGNAFGETGAMHSDTWERVARGTPEYNDGIATEIVQLAEDPTVQFMFSEAALAGDNVAATKAWLLTDPEGMRVLNVLARKIAEQNPQAALEFRKGTEMLDNYLQWVNARGHLKAGGDYVFRDPDSGALMNSADKPVSTSDPWFNTAGPGITITRAGHADILKSYETGRLLDSSAVIEEGAEGIEDLGVAVSRMTDQKYKKLREEMARRLDESVDPVTGASNFPEYVKYESSAHAYDHTSVAHSILDFFMDMTVSKPASVLNRNVTFKQFYWHAMATRIPSMTDEVAAKAIAQAKKEGVWGRVKQIMKETGEQPRVISEMKNADLYAKSWAATATKDLLFDFAERKNFFDALTLISPFADAWLELFTSWGRLFGQNPLLVRRPLKAFDELRQDNPQDWGEDEFNAEDGFFYKNSYGEEVFAIPFAADIVNALADAIPFLDDNLPEMKFEIPIQSLNMVAGQFYPVVGPIVTIPAAGFIPDTPGWTKLKKVLAPFGMEETLGDEFLSETIGGSPSLKRFINGVSHGTFYGGEDERVFNNTIGYMVKDILTSGEYTYEELADPDIRAEVLRVASDRASDVYVIRSVIQFLAPAAPGGPLFLWTPDEIADMDEDQQIVAIALQDSANAYYNILADEAPGDYEAATKIFTDRYGFDPTATLVSASTETGKNPTRQTSYEWKQDNPEVYKQFKRTAYYLHPDDPLEDWYTPAWNEQFSSGERVSKPVEDQLAEYQSRMGNLEYNNAIETLDETLAERDLSGWEEKDIEKLRSAVLDIIKADIIERNPSYEATVGTFTSAERQAAIAELRDWQNYSPLDDDPTQKGVTEFMDRWDEAFGIQLGLDVGSRTANPLPFMRNASSTIGGENWAKRMIVNTTLLDIGDEMAKDKDYGYFSKVWEEVIKPSIYDYRKDLEPEPIEEAEPVDIDSILEEAFG
jgi:hypothetical protein